MGIRSDAGLALSKALYDKITPEQKKEWFKDCAATIVRADAALFIWEDVKWYPSFPEIVSLTKWLGDQGDDEYLLVVATPDYPDDEEDCMGSWYSNPFDLHKWKFAGIDYTSE